MGKLFLEVFPTLELKGEAKFLFSRASVRRIHADKAGKLFDIYAESPNLIQYDLVRRTENELSKQLFKKRKAKFRIHTVFSLTESYTASHLFKEYISSMEDELREKSPILLNLLKQAEVSFPAKDGLPESADSFIELRFPDNIVSRASSKKLQEYLEHVMNSRCGMNAVFKCSFTRQEKSQKEKDAEIRVQNEIRAITEAAYGKKDGAENPQNETHSSPVSHENPETQSRPNSKAREKDSSIIFGHNYDEEPMPISEIIGEIGDVTIRGQLIFYSERPISNDRFVISIDITDRTDSITLKLFLKGYEVQEFRERIGASKLEKSPPVPTIFVKVKGIAVLDTFEHDLTIGHIKMIQEIPPFFRTQEDLAPRKRVELHCHTRMSELDGISDVADILKRACDWGMKAIAITDHGVAYSFPDAFHYAAAKAPKGFKVIYGCEGYIIDDTKDIFWYTGEAPENPIPHPLDSSYVVFDIETTGLNPDKNRITEIGAVRIENGQIVSKFEELINPGVPIPINIQTKTGITDDMVSSCPSLSEILPKFLDFCSDAVIVAHNAAFDTLFLRKAAVRLGLTFDKFVLDTVGLSQLFLKLGNYKLDRVAKDLKVTLINHHRAMDDAEAAGNILLKLLEKAKEKDFKTIEEIGTDPALKKQRLNSLHANHIILLAKNEVGRVNLYELISRSHLEYFHKRPRIPKSLLTEHREGLIIGTACEAGELYQALERGESDKEIARIINFYDYLEIQPIGNNAFLLEKDNSIETEEDLRNLNRRIVELGKIFRKPVCATSDSHFLDPEDEVYRRIIMSIKGFEGADKQPPLYLHTTDWMLEEFSYLGEDTAEEVVIDNTNMIADMVDYINPVRPDKAPPVIENSDQVLRDICERRARELYGENLPEKVSKRLETELDSIINNGYAVMYVIAQKLVWKSNEDGYLVGSRGSVGSSLAAYMAGITEVNSLPPHYLCPSCHYYDFDSPTVKSFAEKSMCGSDMPDKNCPVCGTLLKKTGFDIPFATFLGFKGDKEPDIDLNFSSDYQSKAHKYTEGIFGAGQTYRAGTMGTLQDKTALGYVNKYLEEHGKHKRKPERARLSHGIEGVLRSTGQHPGGIVVLPRGESIYSFTPLQHPANKESNAAIVTTHLEYHSIDHNLLKLDILGHDDPTMIKYLEDTTGVDPKTIELDDPQVMSLFSSPAALGLKSEDLEGCPTGTYGIPEFGTDFVIGMLKDTHPTSFSDLVRISGLSHGTDVWTGNAQMLVNDMKMQLSDCICCRDDIMLYLMNKGMDSQLSFKIMESVRKGKGLTEEMKEAMKAAEVPDWYIDSCLKIKYMFPKAHAAAYVMMAWRVAWYKINYPAAYYAGYFSIRAMGSIDYATMCRGLPILKETEKALKDKLQEVGKKKMTSSELDTLKEMRLVKEMYARGIEFVPLDLSKADSRYFTIIDDHHIMPCLSCLSKLGLKAASDILTHVQSALKDGPFLSIDDFLLRTGTGKSTTDTMKSLGLLGDIPESNQLSLFDMMA